MLSLVLLLVGVVGSALSLGCAPLEAHWPTWVADDAFQFFRQWPSKWKLAGWPGCVLAFSDWWPLGSAGRRARPTSRVDTRGWSVARGYDTCFSPCGLGPATGAANPANDL